MSWSGETIALPQDAVYTIGSGPYSMTPEEMPVSPEPVQTIRSDTHLVAPMGGYVSVATVSTPGNGLLDALTPKPGCGCRACASREAHSRAAMALCGLAFLVLLGVYIAHHHKR